MNAYTCFGDMYCESCANKIKNQVRLEPAERPQGPFSEGGGEADIPQHCNDCGIFLENPLTAVGYDYVYKQAEVDLTEAVSQWLEFYGISDEKWDGSEGESDAIDDELLDELHDHEDYDEDFDLGDDIDEDFDMFADDLDDDSKTFKELYEDCAWNEGENDGES